MKAYKYLFKLCLDFLNILLYNKANRKIGILLEELIMRKRILSVILAGALSASVIAGGAISASATRNADDTYTPDGVDANTYYFAMPGAWQSDYWKENVKSGGLYWWTGADTPGSVFSHDWPGYKIYEAKDEENVKNLYYSPCPKDANQIIFNNNIDGGMPGTEGFIQEKFDASCQIKDTGAQFYTFGESDYYTRDVWMYVWDKVAEYAECDPIQWSDTTQGSMTKDEKEQIAAVYEAALEADPEDFSIQEFGKYSNNFVIDDSGDGYGLMQIFDNMVYVCNLDPNTMIKSYTIVPKENGGKITYGGDWFFYYGNGEYGIWPTKELMMEKSGITFDENGNAVAPEGYVLNDQGAVCRILKGYDSDDNEVDQKLMVFGNFTGKYFTDNTVPQAPTTPGGTVVPTTTIPAASQDATSATKANSGSGTSATNSSNGSVATGDFSYAAVAFVVIAGALGVFFFTRKRYNK